MGDLLSRIARLTLMTLLVAITYVSPADAQGDPGFAIELEAGPVWQSRNDVQIPNDETGTRFSLQDLAGNGPWFAGRLYATWNLRPRHGLRLLLAPLSISVANCTKRWPRRAPCSASPPPRKPNSAGSPPTWRPLPMKRG